MEGAEGHWTTPTHWHHAEMSARRGNSLRTDKCLIDADSILGLPAGRPGLSAQHEARAIGAKAYTPKSSRTCTRGHTTEKSSRARGSRTGRAA